MPISEDIKQLEIPLKVIKSREDSRRELLTSEGKSGAHPHGWPATAGVI
ncbi:MAG: hypothetical protein HQM08_15075 [Candidatus Riflebacteria bacterium]|nr:hypothetical protein [Candidatus Riflebacteria bacterium]